MIEYMILDACHKLSVKLHSIKDGGHGKRINILCQKFGIPLGSALTDKIVKLRNDLFHEMLWDNSEPCSGASSDTFMLSFHLRKLNQRLIPALLHYRNSYVQTVWWCLGSSNFDRAQL